MKRTIVALGIFLCALAGLSLSTGLPAGIPQAFAHPGNTASDGCHYCWTNCSSWGEVYGARHCHGGGSYSTPSYSYPTYTAPSIPSCPIFSTYNSLTDSCTCMSGYIAQGGSCVSANIYCWDEYGYGSTYSSLYNRCECSYGYTMRDSQCVTDDQACKQDYGRHAKSTFGGKCSCEYGYEWNDAGTLCVEEEDEEESVNIDPEVWQAYLKLLENQNTTSTPACGLHSEPTGDGKCNCEDGYEWVSDKPDDLDCKKKVVIPPPTPSPTPSFTSSAPNFSYLRVRKQIACRNRDSNDARCFWAKVELAYNQKTNAVTPEDPLTDQELARISQKLRFLEDRYTKQCEEATNPGNFCGALGRLIEAGTHLAK